MPLLDSTPVRVLAVGLAAGAAGALIGDAAAAALGIHALSSPDLTPKHIVVAAVAANLAGAALFAVLLRRGVARPARLYSIAALALATAASIKVVLLPPAPGFALVATGLHYVVALVSSALVPWFFAASPLDAPAAAAPVAVRPASRALLSLLGVVTALAPEIADFNATHLENDAWSPHARYHGVLLACAMVAVGATAVALVWRPAPAGERRLRVALAAFLPAAVWAGFFVALAFPDASSWPDGAARPLAVAPNVFVAGILVALAALAWRLDRAD